MAVAHKTGQWTLESQKGLESLHYDANATESEQDIGPDDVLVELHAASLNYRDLVVTEGAVEGSPMEFPILPSMVPASDGAGRILKIGSAVASARPNLKPGVDVMLYMVPHVSDGELPSYDDISKGLGGHIHGTLAHRGVFHHGLVVPKPITLSYAQAATLCCSGLTAWNALMGYKGHEVKEGDWVLVQGTGGVSIAALQIALAVGAKVIATTSSDTKAERLRALGTTHILNYRSTPNWGEHAKSLTPSSRGVDHVVDVGGPTTLPESLKAIRRDGLITLAGLVGGLTGEGGVPVDIMNAMFSICVLRGVLLGSRGMLRDMVRFIDEKKVPIAHDDIEFALADANKAYERLKQQKHFAKVVIKMDH
ncbi:NAD(P)-binding protein [Xylariaceae sp. FL0255]|nr:NAD(P)-binding protein [Xylariaceae sp. FL0255]